MHAADWAREPFTGQEELDERHGTQPSLAMTDLLDQFQQLRTQLTDEKRSLQARIALIDKALAGHPVTAPKKDTAKEPRAGTLTDLILQALSTGPATIKELQATLAAHPPKSIDTTVRQLAAGGRLTKDDQTPRRFSVPSTVLKAV